MISNKETQTDMETLVENHYKNIIPYTGKETFTIDGTGTKVGFGLIIGSLVLLIVFSLIMLIVCLIIILRAIYRKVFITKDGIKLVNKGNSTTRFFSWDEINVIGIGVYPFGVRPTSGFLYFTTKDITDDLVIPSYCEAPDVIVVKYRPEVVHCVLNYWNKDIRNLDSQESWQKYIDQL